MARRAVFWMLLVALATGGLSACGDDSASPPTTTGSSPTSATGPATSTASTSTTITTPTSSTPATTAVPTTTAAGATSVRIYLVRDQVLAPVRRTIAPTLGVGSAALQQLIAGPSPTESAYSSTVPATTAVRSLSISDGTATVDLSSAFGSGGGSLSMRMRVAQVVWTLTQFPTVQRVVFRIDGVANPVLGGEGLLLDHPFTRVEYFDGDLLPRLLVESPLPGDAGASPLRVSGLGSVFEATFNIQVIDAAGVTVYDKPAMTSEGQRMAPFDVTVTFTPTRAGPVTLRVFDYSAKDGSVQDLVVVPLSAP